MELAEQPRQQPELGVDRLVMMLGSQRPEKIPARLGEIETLVKKAA